MSSFGYLKSERVRKLVVKRDAKGLLNIVQKPNKFSIEERVEAITVLPALMDEARRMRGLGLVRTINREYNSRIILALRDVAVNDQNKRVAAIARKCLMSLPQ